MRLLITGCRGFVSRHLLRHLEQHQIDADVLGVSRSRGAWTERFTHIRFRMAQLDMLDRDGVDAVLADFRPTHVVHLAADSSVGTSWRAPVESFANNTNILLNLLEQARRMPFRCRVLSVGSSEEYGQVDGSDLPLSESAPLRPTSPYGVARVAQEMLSQVYVRGFGLDVVMTRSFNHIGTLQRDAFVVPSLARQLVAIRRGAAAPRLETGDRSIVRDFIDVRDVVDAYVKLLLRGETGEIYNVCSGRGVSIDRVVSTLQSIAQTDADVVTKSELIRPTDNPCIIGSSKKLHDALGWQPSIPLEDSLRDIFEWWDQGCQ